MSKVKIFRFYDMHSGGGQKLEHGVYYVRAFTEKEAVEIFKDKTGRDPDNVTCSCCGEDYSYWETDEGHYLEEKEFSVMLNEVGND